MSRGIQVDDDTDVVVERKGYGAHAWRWRLSDGVVTLAASERAFRCAEEAYHDGRANLLTLRATDARLGRRAMELGFAEDMESLDLAAEA